MRRFSRRDFVGLAALAFLGAWWGLRRKPPLVGGSPKTLPDPLAGVDLSNTGPFIWDEDYGFEFIRRWPYSELVKNNPTPVEKYALIRKTLLDEGLPLSAFTAPPDFGYRELATVHSRLYLDALHVYAYTHLGALLGENIIVPGNLHFAWKSVAGTYMAARIALARGVGMNLGGGFHHAFPTRAEGFCHLNDTAVAVECLRAQGLARNIMIVDLDVHHGNGNATIYLRNAEVPIFDIYQSNNYPRPKFIETAYGAHFDSSEGAVSDEKYLHALESLPAALDAERPDLVIYLAGADPFKDDMLGGFSLSKEGLKERDRLVISAARQRKIPVAVSLAGGYPKTRAVQPDVVEIHTTTARWIRAQAGVPLLPPD